MIFQIAIRNLLSSFLNFVIGSIIFVGTLLVVVGGSLLNSMDSAMSRSIIGSVAGHIQVYSEKSKDDLALYGSFSFPDIAAIKDFSAIKAPLLSIQNIKAVIPMGVNGASVPYGNTMDMTLEKLRKSINKKIAGDSSESLLKQIESHKDHIRQMISVLKNDSKKLAVMAASQAIDTESFDVIDRANSEEFWTQFDRDPLVNLEFLENRIASLIPDADFIQLSYVGTDLDAFSKSFDRMEIVDGQSVPSGKRGLLLSKYVYENQFKLKIARRLDKIHEALNDEGKVISDDPDLKQFVKQNRTQTREIILQLDSISAKKIISLLQSFLKSKETKVAHLLSEFFDTNDLNFEARYKFFYSELAPLLELYRLRPGDIITIKAFTKSGFVQSVNMKVYGTFHFKGLEKSGLAGGLSLMDMMSFRDLYGYVTAEKIAETKALQQDVGARIIDRDQAEAELFGSAQGTAVVSSVKDAKQEVIQEDLKLASGKNEKKNDSTFERIYTPSEIENGVVLNAAIILKDPTQINQTMKEIEELSGRSHLDLKVLTWQKAAGTIGQFVLVAKVALYAAVFIIFIVALVIINNAVMMATLQRIREIGTMRAIGAQRSFILKMILIETVFLGLVFGTGGILAGSGIIRWLGNVGIPAKNEFLYFFFSGPRLFPAVTLGTIIMAFVIIFIVTLFSTLYPAILATQVSPLQAMQAED
ncbi:MAG: FtsX-like permease family protein [Bdellovibrionia bacterium]